MNNNDYDLILKNGMVVRPNSSEVLQQDIAIKNGKIDRIDTDIQSGDSAKVINADQKLIFPGLVDAHMHTGIYGPLSTDARSESAAAAQGGVTSMINYIRTGQYYLNESGPYSEFFPKVLEQSDGNYFVDYAYHLAPMMGEHIDEIEMLIEKYGVLSFKIFMFYGSHGLHGKSGNQSDFLMIGEDEKYDIAHFEFIMRGIKKAMDRFPAFKDSISLSLHCETAEIMTAYTKIVEKDSSLKGLAAYHHSRPPHSEGLAIFIASYLAYETDCTNINLLHLTSRKALEAALKMEEAFPHINFGKEVTVGHLLLDIDCPNGAYAKVNPPIRPREDVEYLWSALLDGKIDWVVSDHACCAKEIKTDKDDPEDIFLAKSGFGGTEYLLSGLYSEGIKRGLSLNNIAKLVCLNPAQRYGLKSKGDIQEGFDADLVIFDPEISFTVDSAKSESSQGYSPFEGYKLNGKVISTILGGNTVYDQGKIISNPLGKYLKRPH